METTRLSLKGQIVIPHRIRAQFRWEPGLEFVVEPIEGGVALRPLKGLPAATIDEAYGCLAYDGPPKSLQDMEDGIRKGASQRR